MKFYENEIKALKKAGRYRMREVINYNVKDFASNDYLGLSHNKELHQKTCQELNMLEVHSTKASMLVNGYHQIHKEFEDALCEANGFESGIVLGSGFNANIALIESLVRKGDTLFMDELYHASGVLASQLNGIDVVFFKHNDMDDLEKQLKLARKSKTGGVLIVTEGVFGMRGDLAKLDQICDLKDQYEARVFVDDAHGCGVMGKNGRGTPEHFGMIDRVDLYFSTFAKAFAAIGGFTCGDEEVIRYIHYNARTHIFAKSLPMLYVETVNATLDKIEKEPQHRERLWEVARMLQEGLKEMGYNLGDTQSPITPVYVPAEPDVAMSIVAHLRENESVFVSGVMYPVVPKGVILLRMIPTAAHSDEDVEKTLIAFKNLRDEYHLKLSEVNI